MHNFFGVANLTFYITLFLSQPLDFYMNPFVLSFAATSRRSAFVRRLHLQPQSKEASAFDGELFFVVALEQSSRREAQRAAGK